VVGMSTEQLRDSFLIADIFWRWRACAAYSPAPDRLVVGGAMRLRPCNYRTTQDRAGFLFGRRELGAINVVWAGHGPG